MANSVGNAIVIESDEDEDEPLNRDAFLGPDVIYPRNNGVNHPVNGRPTKVEDIQAACRKAAFQVFPDICPDFLEGLARQYAYDPEQVISAVLDKGTAVPNRPRANLKRKRESDDVGDRLCDRKKKYDNDDWRQSVKLRDYINTACGALRSDFPYMRAKDVNAIFDENHQTLYASYLRLVKMEEADESYNPKKQQGKKDPELAEDRIDQTIARASNTGHKMALEELKIARLAGEELRCEIFASKEKEDDEELNKLRAIQEGTMTDCECCCEECPLNRMVHCNGEILHWFCRDCARRDAESQIGFQKFELKCMSTDGCNATFSRDQQAEYLDEKTAVALERIEQEVSLRLAGIENLESCPFCPFAAEYPPVEEDKEFRCQRPDCEMVSCRLCRKETHIPKTCEEASHEDGHHARRMIEEKMSEALIRKCNKCQTPFIKNDGCNKMTCTKCRNIQCYVCHKSCDYTHFNDAARGGKVGNCPLFEQTEERHEKEVQAAEEEARKKVLEEHPEVDAEVLKIKVSEKVKEDEERRRRNPVNHLAGPNLARLHHPAFGVAIQRGNLDFRNFVHGNPNQNEPPLAERDARTLLAQPQAQAQLMHQQARAVQERDRQVLREREQQLRQRQELLRRKYPEAPQQVQQERTAVLGRAQNRGNNAANANANAPPEDNESLMARQRRESLARAERLKVRSLAQAQLAQQNGVRNRNLQLPPVNQHLVALAAQAQEQAAQRILAQQAAPAQNQRRASQGTPAQQAAPVQNQQRVAQAAQNQPQPAAQRPGLQRPQGHQAMQHGNRRLIIQIRRSLQQPGNNAQPAGQVVNGGAGGAAGFQGNMAPQANQQHAPRAAHIHLNAAARIATNRQAVAAIANLRNAVGPFVNAVAANRRGEPAPAQRPNGFNNFAPGGGGWLGGQGGP